MTEVSDSAPSGGEEAPALYLEAYAELLDEDFRSRRGISEAIQPVDGNAGCWRRGR
jgi:hypothetical protein